MAVLHFEKGEVDEDFFGAYTRRPLPVRARKMDVEFSCVTVDGNFVTGQPGDYLVLDAKGFPYPCNGEIFERTHDPEVASSL